MNPFEYFIGTLLSRSLFVCFVLTMATIVIYGWGRYLFLIPRERRNPVFIVFWFVVAVVPMAYQRPWNIPPNP